MIAAGQNLKRLLNKRGWGRRPCPAEAVCALFLAVFGWQTRPFLAYWSFSSTIGSDYPMILKECNLPLLMSFVRMFFNRLLPFATIQCLSFPQSEATFQHGWLLEASKMIMRPERETEEHRDPCLGQTDSRYAEGPLRESGPAPLQCCSTSATMRGFQLWMRAEGWWHSGHGIQGTSHVMRITSSFTLGSMESIVIPAGK